MSEVREYSRVRLSDILSAAAEERRALCRSQSCDQLLCVFAVCTASSVCSALCTYVAGILCRLLSPSVAVLFTLSVLGVRGYVVRTIYMIGLSTHVRTRASSHESCICKHTLT